VAQEVERPAARAAWAQAPQEPALARVERETVARALAAMELGLAWALALARELGAAAAVAAVEADRARVQGPVLAQARESAGLVPSRESLAQRMASFKRLCWARQTRPRPIPKVLAC